MSGLEDAWNNCSPPQGPRPKGLTEGFSFIAATTAVGLFLTAAGISWLLNAFGFSTTWIIATIANFIEWMYPTGLLFGLLSSLIWLMIFCLCRLYFRIGDTDFSALAGLHEGLVESVTGRITTQVPDDFRGRQAKFSVFPFQDGDYLYNIRLETAFRHTSKTVGGAIVNLWLPDFIVRTPGGAPATVYCDSRPEIFMHCEIDSARKWGGHIGAIIAMLAIIILAIYFAPITELINRVCSIPFIGEVICAAIGLFLGGLALIVGGAIGGAIGDGVDALNDPEDDVLEGDWKPADGDRVVASGIWVTDLDHGHNELHPLQSLRLVTGRIDREMEDAGKKKAAHLQAAGVALYED